MLASSGPQVPFPRKPEAVLRQCCTRRLYITIANLSQILCGQFKDIINHEISTTLDSEPRVHKFPKQFDCIDDDVENFTKAANRR